MIKIIACEVMKEELLASGQDSGIEFEFVSMGLHLYPEKLQRELQEILNRSSGYERVILSFGLCGGAARDLRAPDCTLTMPRVHDCIPILLGSKEMHRKFAAEELGTLYLTCGWLSTEKATLSEYQRVLEKYGEKKAKGVMQRMYDSYRRVLYIHTGHKEDACYLQKSVQVAQLLDLKHQATDGDLSFIRKIVNGPWDEENFINVPPDGLVHEEDFLYHEMQKERM